MSGQKKQTEVGPTELPLEDLATVQGGGPNLVKKRLINLSELLDEPSGDANVASTDQGTAVPRLPRGLRRVDV